MMYGKVHEYWGKLWWVEIYAHTFLIIPFIVKWSLKTDENAAM